jgi:hypothetical protein
MFSILGLVNHNLKNYIKGVLKSSIKKTPNLQKKINPNPRILWPQFQPLIFIACFTLTHSTLHCNEFKPNTNLDKPTFNFKLVENKEEKKTIELLKKESPEITKYLEDLKSQNVMVKGTVYAKNNVNDKSLNNNKTDQQVDSDHGIHSIIAKNQRAGQAQSLSQAQYCIGCKWCGAPKSCGFGKCPKCTALVPACRGYCTCSALET